MNMDGRLLIAAGCPIEIVSDWLRPIEDTCEVYEINTPGRVACFLAQVAHESDSFRHTVENLNYSADALQRVFGRYFPTPEIALDFARQPEKIANRVYANRLGNGPEESGDGWKFRGRGLIQLTGKENVRQFSQHYYGNDTLVHNPSPIEEPKLAAMSAGWYWDSRELNILADKNDMEGITKKINGGVNGLSNRIDCWEQIRKVNP